MSQNTETKDFTEVVDAIDAGGLTQELNEKLQKVVQAVRETGKKGSVSLTLSIDMKGAQVEVTSKVKTKAPNPDRPAQFFYYDEDGNLFGRDPRQTEIDFRSTPEEERTLKSIGGAER